MHLLPERAAPPPHGSSGHTVLDEVCVLLLRLLGQGQRDAVGERQGGAFGGTAQTLEALWGSQKKEKLTNMLTTASPPRARFKKKNVAPVYI